MRYHRTAIMAALLAAGLAANDGALAASSAAAASYVRKAAAYRPVHAVYRGAPAGAIVPAEAGRAVQPQAPPAPDEPTVNLATGTARYDMGPTGLHDEAPTFGLVMKF